jgi:hypothetical protein
MSTTNVHVIAVVINMCYQPFGLSEEGKELFKQKSGMNYGEETPRHDPSLVYTVKKTGAISSHHVVVKYIPSVMEEYYKIIGSECERIVLLYQKKTFDEINKIIKSSFSSEEKLEKITEVLSGQCTDMVIGTQPSDEDYYQEEN